MTKNLFAFVTFGLPEFTQLTIQSIKETVTSPYDIFAIVGKPGDDETKNLLDAENIPCKVHTENLGFPASLNDIYDYAWKEHDYDNLILLGNDVILYPYAGDSLISVANTTDYEIISGLQYDVRDFTKDFPETRKYFSGDNYIINDFSSQPWKQFTGYSDKEEIAPMQLVDIQNMCLYKRETFDKIGYTDVNFFPAYFVDNDYARRIHLSNIKCCTLNNARFFHFWSRVFKQGSGGSTDYYFECNLRYYRQKWGGYVGKEKNIPELGIFSRENELKTIRRWRIK